MKIIRCKDCALDGNPECPLSYIEKQTLCFVEHSPMFFCGKAKPTEDYQPTNGDVIQRSNYMPEYIDKAELIKKLLFETGEGICSPVIKTIKEFPAVYELSVDKWISVDDELPDTYNNCLVWYSCDTAFGKDKRFGITFCLRGDWYTKLLDGDNIVVLYWQYLPDYPKG